MIRILFGLVLALLMAVPQLLDITMAAVAWTLGTPSVLAFAAGVLAWPRLARTVRKLAQ
ncbi:hypothetical protein [Streptomyces sp. NPDC052225]|uniref:hypothetical protein n=1 Tax=Streptomyces sp. NPDC052225 TaxID=3154949 RepID=UPI003421A03A